jgi:hypothetical protein
VRRIPSFIRIVLCDRSGFPKLQINKSPVVGHPTIAELMACAQSH